MNWILKLLQQSLKTAPRCSKNGYTIDCLFFWGGNIVEILKSKKQERKKSQHISAFLFRAMSGIVAFHAFGVLAAYEGHGVQLLQLRNPWGNYKEWTGAWCDDSEEWTSHPDVAKDVKFKPRADGIFWMSFEDWEQNFNGFHVLKLEQKGPRASLLAEPCENVREEKERQKKEEEINEVAAEMYSNGGWYVGKGMDFMGSRELEEVRLWESKALYEEVVKMCCASWKCSEIRAKDAIDNPRHHLPFEVRTYLKARWMQKTEEEKAEAALPKKTPAFMGVKGAKQEGECVRYDGMVLPLTIFKQYVEDGLIKVTEPKPEAETGEAVVNSVRGKLSLREKSET